MEKKQKTTIKPKKDKVAAPHMPHAHAHGKAPEIVQSGDPVLHKPANAVNVDDIKSAKVQKVIADMVLALESQSDGVGLAAPQIGIPMRIFMVSGTVFDRQKKTAGNPHQVFINPVITKFSKEKKWMEGEGCLSVRWLYGKVKRSTKVTLEAYDEKGNKHSRGAGGLLAHIFQHEVDHLDGILFTEKAKDLKEFDPAEIQAEIAADPYIQARQGIDTNDTELFPEFDRD